ncbi:hypothetical protein I3760_11G202500 [Carya illinoinensis]|nr:hypothetical protein I3760_11G202500 [Carya illinoinensis]
MSTLLFANFLHSTEKAQDAIFYSYTRFINGFAAVLEEEEAEMIAKNPKVLSVFLNQGRKLHTTRSWDFLGLERVGTINGAESAWKTARFGEDTIIGNLDTGEFLFSFSVIKIFLSIHSRCNCFDLLCIFYFCNVIMNRYVYFSKILGVPTFCNGVVLGVWPESKSFNDEGMGPIPSRWRGICQRGNNDGVRCNRKLIGVRYFNKGHNAFARISPNSSQFTARDHSGHGSHTLSTAGGSFVPGSNVLGNGNGTAKGGSPKARVAAYKVCWPPLVEGGGECFDADIMAAFDAAIADGVDVLSVSLGGSGPNEFFKDAIAIGSFHAVKNGIVVVSSAGNEGPGAGTISNGSPWIFTVAASTLDREFANYVSLGNKLRLKGTSLSTGGLPSNNFYPMISAEDAAAANASAPEALLCQAGTLDPKKVKGKILVCLRGENARVDKGYQALAAGAVGMILANDESNGNGVSADPHLLPTSHISYTDGQRVFAYLRRPNLVEPSILKPDITAPGVDIIAAYTEAVSPTDIESDKRRFSYNVLSGTSMSCPHVSGIVGLLKTLHPTWSPAAIKSAIMTTAKTRDNRLKPILNSANLKATPLEYGAGHVQPNRAVDPGLVYDLTVDDYLKFLCAHGYNQTMIQIFADKPYACRKSFQLVDFNYPSITIPNLHATPVTVTRTVTNVGSPCKYNVTVQEPAGVSVSVEPTTLEFKSIGEKKTFKITLKTKARSLIVDYVFGHLIWSDGKHFVRSPISVSSNSGKISSSSSHS